MSDLCDFTDDQLAAELKKREEARARRLCLAQEVLRNFVRGVMVQPSDLGIAVADQVRASLGTADMALFANDEHFHKFNVRISLWYEGDKE